MILTCMGLLVNIVTYPIIIIFFSSNSEQVPATYTLGLGSDSIFDSSFWEKSPSRLVLQTNLLKHSRGKNCRKETLNMYPEHL